MFDDETRYYAHGYHAQPGTTLGGAARPYAAGPDAATGPASDEPDQPIEPALGPDHIPPRPGVSLIDAGLGAGYLVSRLAAGPVRAAARTGRRLAPPARRALHAPAPRGLTDLSEWVLHTLAQIGAPQRSRAEHRIRVIARSATGAIAANRDVDRLIHDLAARQVRPLVDEALPLVLGRLDEQPEQVRRIVRDQSRGILAEARDTARTAARQGDDMIDSVVDRLLRRRAPATPAAPAQAAPVDPVSVQAAPVHTAPVDAAPVPAVASHAAPAHAAPAQAPASPAAPTSASPAPPRGADR